MPANNIFKVAITGNIGSGKSSFCQYLQELREEVISADEVANEILMEEKLRWAARWGSRAFSGGQIDRRKIAEIVFEDQRELRFLNSILHPQVMLRFSRLALQSTRKLLFFEIPLLFEAKLESHFDYLVLVTAKKSLVLQRLNKRNPGQMKNLRLRLARQIPDSDKSARVDHVIYNNKDLAALKLQAIALLHSLQNTD